MSKIQDNEALARQVQDFLNKRFVSGAPLVVDSWGGKVTQDRLKEFDATLSELFPKPASGTSGNPEISSRRINERGLELVKHFEGLYLNAYLDPVGIWTIGWGHTGLQHRDGTVFKGRKITESEAVALLRYDMQQFEKRVETFVAVPLNDDQFSALVSFDFNTGGLGKSTLLKKLNASDYTGAANEFLKWTKGTVNGKKVSLPGLVRRRKSEKRLFEGMENPIVLT